MSRLSTCLTALFATAAVALALSPAAVNFALAPGKGLDYKHDSRSQNRTAPAHGQERVVRLYGAIDGEMADTVKSRLHELDSADPGKPITLVITSKGGGVPAGLDIIDTMANLKSPVNTLCERWCTSMAAVITAAGAHRSAQPHAILRYHEVELDDDQQLRTLEQDHLLDILAEHSGKPRATWEAVFREGQFISAQRALALGALDEIQPPSHCLAPPRGP